MNKPEIVFDAERMKNPHTGFYHFCLQLGHALMQQQSGHDHILGFFLPQKVSGIFGDEVPVIKQMPLHKLFMSFAKNVKLWHCTNQLSSYFPANKKIKVVLTVHDLNFIYEKENKKKRDGYLKLVQKKIDRADAIVAISHFVKQQMETHLQLRDKTVQVIYNGCNINDAITAKKPARAIPDSFIFSIGTINAKKNLHVLPATIAENNLHLVIAGALYNKEYLQRIYAQAEALGVADRVHYIGTVTEAEKYWLMEHCSLFAFPSLAEGFGLPVIEAMRFGKPVLLSTATSLPEIGGPFATYLNSMDSSHIEEQANNAIAKHDDAMQKSVIEWSQKFEWKDAASAYWTLYEKLLK